ncbi:protein tyrosine phosphatase type IVA 2 isoform X1 [Orcinus orca]|uniref:protein tyrosine phosphatase type IVA 2 isoform X1 n=1 Tax=Orcinus orca TaxID=9733 RepID=UPI002112614C|nr:protein tyrosine phosphatase type IVA 2 isoform X1 [Orcinus orca]XP_049570378.1 protein tyrosine phosphatase type IVA 2 isoform X1 [Orcinus orca]XP_049570399.1 protein tyrosine phosphatase type IVA 2 isoform X1 [Orcinus orca]
MDAPSAARSAERNEPRGGAGEAPRAVGQRPAGQVGGPHRPEPARQPVSGRGGRAGGRARRAPQRPLRGGGGSWFRLRAQRWWRRRDRPGCNRRPSGSGWSGSGGRARREATPQGSGGSGDSGGSRRRSGGRSSSSSKTDSWTRAAAAGPGRVSRAEAGGEPSPPPLPPPPPPPR